jgi:hypothetical protein
LDWPIEKIEGFICIFINGKMGMVYSSSTEIVVGGFFLWEKKIKLKIILNFLFWFFLFNCTYLLDSIFNCLALIPTCSSNSLFCV